jgi:N-acetylglucosaminyldiphosphoundecaprenol N-acetyl-beta-D-mannosaminyltransferase
MIESQYTAEGEWLVEEPLRKISAAPNPAIRTAPAPGPGITMMGVTFDRVSLAQALARIEEMVTSRQLHYVVTPNVDFLVQAQRDVELRRILFDASLVLCDGTPLLWVSRLLGNPLPERVAGADLVPRLIEMAPDRAWRLFFLGGAPDVTSQAVLSLRKKYPGLTVAGHYSPPFRPLLEMDNDEIARRIRAAKPDLLFVSFGCPKAEKWIAMHYRSLDVPVIIGVGATIDFLAGKVKRAPSWMQRAGLEWVFRLSQEPRRLLRRYAADLWHFSRGIAVQCFCLQRRPRRARRPERFSVLMAEPRWLRIEAPERLDAGVVSAADTIWAGGFDRHCLLDLAAVKFIDSTGVALLAQWQKQLRAGGRHLILMAPSRAVRRALRLMRIEHFFATAQDATEAREWIGPLLDSEDDEQPVLLHGAARSALAWRGEITAANAEELWKETERQLVALSSRNKHFSIDLSGLRFIDSAGVGLMLRAHGWAQRQGACVRFVDAPPNVQSVLRLAAPETRLLESAV